MSERIYIPTYSWFLFTFNVNGSQWASISAASKSDCVTEEDIRNAKNELIRQFKEEYPNADLDLVLTGVSSLGRMSEQTFKFNGHSESFLNTVRELEREKEEFHNKRKLEKEQNKEEK